jgi:hypothetical protein
MTMFTRPSAWTALALTVSLTAVLSTGAASAARSTLPPLLKIKSGTANFCLDPAAQTALDMAGIGMSAGAPAQLVSTAPQPCATTHVTEGAVTLGLTDGSFPFHGTITFTRATDQAAITFSDIMVTFAVPSTATAVVNGDTAHPVTWLTFIPLPGNLMTDGRFLFGHDVPLNLTPDGAAAFAKAFGTSPVPAGQPLFAGTGYGELEAGLLPLAPAS